MNAVSYKHQTSTAEGKLSRRSAGPGAGSGAAGAAAVHSIIIKYYGFWSHLSLLQSHCGTTWIYQNTGIIRKVAGAVAAHNIDVEY